MARVVGSSTASAAAASLTWSHQTQEGDGRRLIVCTMTTANPSPSSSNGDYGGQAVQLVSKRANSNAPYVEVGVYECSAPAVGAHDLAMAFTGLTNVAGIAVAIDRANQFIGAPNFSNNLIWAKGQLQAGSEVASTFTAATTNHDPSGLVIAVGDLVLLFACAQPAQVFVPTAGFTLVATVDTPNAAGTLTCWSKANDLGDDTAFGYTFDSGSHTVWTALDIGQPDFLPASKAKDVVPARLAERARLGSGTDLPVRKRR